MLNKIKQNLQFFFITWGVLIVLNQIFIFGACFAPYCLVAALPHTGVIAGLIVYFSNKDEENSNNTTSDYTESSFQKKDTYVVDKIEEDEIDDIEEIKEPYCPKCGSKMVLRTARNGKYAGSNFWGCSQFPKCKSIINI